MRVTLRMLRLGTVRFAEAIALARKQGVVLPEVYYGLLQGAARDQAFSIAGIASLAQLEDVWTDLQRSLADGETFADWQAQAATLALDLPEHRLDNIYRTNLQSAWNRGRSEQIQRNRRTHPWLRYDAVNDSRTRPAHAAMDGKIFHIDDPIWQIWYPPCGYRCRCRVIAMTDAEAKRRIKIGQDAGSDPTARPAVDPDEGWDYPRLVAGVNPEGLRRAVADSAMRSAFRGVLGVAARFGELLRGLGRRG